MTVQCFYALLIIQLLKIFAGHAGNRPENFSHLNISSKLESAILVENGIFLGLLQHGLEIIEPILRRIFMASFIIGYIPVGFRETAVVFISKTSRRPVDESKSYHPTSLTSFLLKAMEKRIDCYIRSEILELRPIHQKLFTYQVG